MSLKFCTLSLQNPDVYYLAWGTDEEIAAQIEGTYIKLMFVNQYWNSTEQKIVYSIDVNYILYIDVLGYSDLVIQIVPNEVIYSKITFQIYALVWA